MNNEMVAELIATLRRAVQDGDTVNVIAIATELDATLTLQEDAALAYFEGQR